MIQIYKVRNWISIYNFAFGLNGTGLIEKNPKPKGQTTKTDGIFNDMRTWNSPRKDDANISGSITKSIHIDRQRILEAIYLGPLQSTRQSLQKYNHPICVVNNLIGPTYQLLKTAVQSKVEFGWKGSSIGKKKI